MYSKICSCCRATYYRAKQRLKELLTILPFPIIPIQVDGGSEFKQDFEGSCKEKQIELIVLSPAKPTYNGGVERENKTFREEFYHLNSLPSR